MPVTSPYCTLYVILLKYSKKMVLTVKFFEFYIFVYLFLIMCLGFASWFFLLFPKSQIIWNLRMLVVHKVKELFLCYNFPSRCKFINQICNFELFFVKSDDNLKKIILWQFVATFEICRTIAKVVRKKGKRKF